MAKEKHNPADPVHLGGGFEPTPTEVHHEVTTAQGSQARGVEHGHEDRDVNFIGVAKWLVVLAVVGAFTHALVWVMIAGMKEDAARKERPPTQIFVSAPPPEPRLLPNPTDTRRLPAYEDHIGPGDAMRIELMTEEQKLIRLGLLDPETRRPIIPQAAADEAVKAGLPAPVGGPNTDWPPPDALNILMPSDASGGLRLENRLR